MIQRLAARFSGFNRNRKIFFNFRLPDELSQPLWPQLQLKRGVVLDRRRGNQAVLILRILRHVGNVSRGSHLPDSKPKFEIRQLAICRAKKLHIESCTVRAPISGGEKCSLCVFLPSPQGEPHLHNMYTAPQSSRLASNFFVRQSSSPASKKCSLQV